MQIMRNFLFLVLILSQFFVGAQHKKQKTDEEIAYEVINFHFQGTDTIDLFNKTISSSDKQYIHIFKENELPPYDYYKNLSYHYKPFSFSGSQEIDNLLNQDGKILFNQKFSELSKVNLKRKKLNKNIQLFPVKEWRYGFEYITFPFQIESNGNLFSFFMQYISSGGGEFYIYQYKNDQWSLLYTIYLYYD